MLVPVPDRPKGGGWNEAIISIHIAIINLSCMLMLTLESALVDRKIVSREAKN